MLQRKIVPVFFFIAVLLTNAFPQSARSFDYQFNPSFLLSEPYLQEAAIFGIRTLSETNYSFRQDEEIETVRAMTELPRASLSFGVQGHFSSGASYFLIPVTATIKSEGSEIAFGITLPLITRRAYTELNQAKPTSGIGDIVFTMKFGFGKKPPESAQFGALFGVKFPTGDEQANANSIFVPLGTPVFEGYFAPFYKLPDFGKYRVILHSYIALSPDAQFQYPSTDPETGDALVSDFTSSAEQPTPLTKSIGGSVLVSYADWGIKIFASPSYRFLSELKVVKKFFTNGDQTEYTVQNFPSSSNLDLWLGSIIPIPFLSAKSNVPVVQASLRIPVFGGCGAAFSLGLNYQL